MNFEPKTEREIEDSRLWKSGEYAFEVVEATDKRSRSSGNEMIELCLQVTDPKGERRTLTDYLVELRAFKLRHAALACGLQNEYENGFLSGQHFVGKTGKLLLGVERPKNGYGRRNVVRDYVLPPGVCDRPTSKPTPFWKDTKALTGS